MLRAIFHSFGFKLLLAGLAVETAMLLALFYSDRNILEDFYEQQTISRLAELRHLLAAATAVPLVERDTATVQDTLETLQSHDDIRYLLLTDRQGNVMARSGWKSTPPRPSPGLPGKAEVAVWHTSVPVSLGGQVYGRLYYGLSTDRFNEARVNMKTAAMLILAAAVMTSTLLFSLLGFWLTRRLRVVAQTAETLASQGSAERLSTRPGGDEIDSLGRSFNAMAEAQEQRLMQLHQRERELKRSNEELQQFVYLASHDLQTPLRTVTSYMQLLEQRYAPQLDEDGKVFIAFAADASRRMSALILNLLRFSRLDASDLPTEKVSMAGVWTKSLDVLASRIAETGAKVELTAPLPEVRGEEGQLVQLFQNLLENALKYRMEGRRPEITLSVQPSGDAWHFILADNGMGVAPEYQERIFKIFQRLHTDDQFEGTGIGLALCRKIVERFGGRIWVESKGDDQGSAFHFTLPSA
ncbi:ATP-binding protein [Magnetospira sp. QH-2]|uniref:sensor histidine kinase n=1 Tax=Magnetospira sp. (strain QH-2) TaxID=1288970 RepID=UPI0003E80C15|nr:ATP-binding protein [Magnetospira sp. QH-2]CCQ73161.1 Putative signal transduction histidine kinase [Magnetospira sp. QH-2]